MTDFKKYRGDTVSLTLTFTASGVVQNIAGWTIWLTLKSSANDPDSAAALQKTATISGDGSTGIATIELSPAETALLLGTYYYDIQYKTGAGAIKTILDGKFTFKKDITRATS